MIETTPQRPDLTGDNVLDRRYEIVLLFDVAHGNPNGDPDADNAPRVDPETGHGLVTDVCMKRKVRNYVTLTRGGEPPYDIYVKERGILVQEQRKAYEAIGLSEGSDSPNDKARAWMCRNYFDVRTFGAVMSTGKSEEPQAEEVKAEGRKIASKGPKKVKLFNCGQVRGPAQFSFAQSVDPIQPLAHAITRVALTNPGDTKRSTVETETGEEKAGTGQMGRKHTVPYGLYRMHGFVSPFLAEQCGFTKADLGVLMEALEHLFDHDRSAARGEMAVRGLFLFEHDSKLGNAPAHKVLETVRLESAMGQSAGGSSSRVVRDFAPYAASLNAIRSGAEVLPGVRVWRYV